MSTPQDELDGLLGDVPPARRARPASTRVQPRSPSRARGAASPAASFVPPASRVSAPVGDRTPRMKAGVRLEGVAPELVNFAAEEDFTVTSGRDAPSVHARNSAHGSGGALDLRTRDKTPEQIEQAKREAQARGLHVAYERAGQGRATGDHLHVELGGVSAPDELDSLLGDVPETSELDGLLADVPVLDPERQKLVEEYGEPVETSTYISYLSPPGGGAPDRYLTNAPPPSAPPPLPQRQTFDPATTDGRAARDARARTERTQGAALEVAAPLPSEDRLSDVAAGAEMVRSAYVRGMVARGVPEVEAEKLVDAHAPTGYSLQNGRGEAVSPADAFTDDALDASARTLRVQLDAAHLSKMVDAYHAGRGTVGRVADWATDDTRSLGEKALDVAAPVAGAAAKVAGYVARPFQAASAGVFAGLRGENPAREAYDTLTTGETSAAGSNPVGNYLRESETLAGVNPRLPALAGGAADLIVDPANLIGLGVLGKGAKAIAGAGRLGRVAEAAEAVGALGRGMVEARPLGLLDEVGDAARAAGQVAEGAEAAGAGLSPAARSLRGEFTSHLGDIEEEVGRVRNQLAERPDDLGLRSDLASAEAARSHYRGLVEQLDNHADELRAATPAETPAASAHPLDEHLADVPAATPQSEALAHARERAAFYDREAAAATNRARRENAATLADDYRAEAARLEAGDARASVEPEGYDLNAPRGTVQPLHPSAAPPQSAPRQALGVAGSAADALKSNLYSADVSAPFRQALFPLAFETGAAARGLVEGLPSVLPKHHAQFVERLRSLPLAQEADGMGLALAALNPDAALEYFPSKVASKLPWVGASERVMGAQLDAVRLNVYERLTGELRAAGLTPANAPEEFRGIAHMVNLASGHGTLGRFMEPAAPVLNKVLGSPKLLKSRFQVLNPLEYARLPPAARKIALRKAARTAAAFTGLFGLAALVADDVGLDPREGNFGTARFGETSYDLTGGEANKIRFIVNLVGSVGKTAKAATSGGSIKYDDTPVGVVGHFLRSQLSPAASVIPDALTGKDYNGRDFTWTEGAIRRAAPLMVQDIYEGFAAEGAAGAAKALPAFVGVSVRQLDPEKVRRDWVKANNRPAPVVLSDPARKELERLGVDLKKLHADEVRPGYTVKGADGEAFKPFSKEDSADVAALSVDDLAGDLATEISEAVERQVNSPDYRSFESDEQRAKFLAGVVRVARARVYAGARLQAREAQLEELHRVEDYQRELEGRSRQVKPGETLKLGDGAPPVSQLVPAHEEMRRAVDAADPEAEPTFKEFPEGAGVSRLPREAMPQVKSEHRGAMVQFLKARGISHTRETVAAGSLRPSQAEWSPEKVARALGFTGPDRALLVSRDDDVADGHHQWLSKLHKGAATPVEVIRLDAPIQRLLVEMARFPSSDVDGASG